MPTSKKHTPNILRASANQRAVTQDSSNCGSAGPAGAVMAPETATNDELKRRTLLATRSMHISCGLDNMRAAMSSEDFIGICVFHPDGNKVFNDRGRKIRSGYIFTVATASLTQPKDASTYHRQAYNLIFDQIEKEEGVEIVGFSQQGKTLKGRSTTFNQPHATNLLGLGIQYQKECLFAYRLLIFGTLIKLKLTRHRNASPTDACNYVCLFLALKRIGIRDPSFLQGIELDHESQFLQILKQLCNTLGMDKWLLSAIFDPVTFAKQPGRETPSKVFDANSAGYGFCLLSTLRGGGPSPPQPRLTPEEIKKAEMDKNVRNASKAACQGIVQDLATNLPPGDFIYLNKKLSDLVGGWSERGCDLAFLF